jgi:DNA-binding transcriptional MerR regulator/methylmalonyl-CoA mutase cobalamin-binding subunit
MTGVDEHTLRIWERRYGFPRPLRSSGGARRYAPSDVHRLKVITRALARGFRPGEIVSQEVAALESLLAMGNAAAPAGARGEIDLLADALKREDINAVRDGLRQLALVLGPRRFVVEVAHPLAVRVGELWASGDLEVHQEHLASECLSTQLRVLRSFFDDTRGPVAVLATLPDEPHGLGLEMVALYLATGGFSPRVVGVSTPTEQIVRAARAHHAAVVGLSVLRSSNLPLAAQAARAIAADLPRGAHLWLGGSGAAALPPVDNARVITGWNDLDNALGAVLSAARLPGSP